MDQVKRDLIRQGRLIKWVLYECSKFRSSEQNSLISHQETLNDQETPDWWFQAELLFRKDWSGENIIKNILNCSVTQTDSWWRTEGSVCVLCSKVCCYSVKECNYFTAKVKYHDVTFIFVLLTLFCLFPSFYFEGSQSESVRFSYTVNFTLSVQFIRNTESN